jgi:hypothetical protein
LRKFVGLPHAAIAKTSILFFIAESREYYRGKYHCTVDLLFGWFGLFCFANKNKNCELSYS